MSKRIDELSKDLASGMSRRKALWRFLAGTGAAVVAGRLAKADNGNNVCVAFCRAQGFEGSDFGHCVSASAHCPPGSCARFDVNGGAFVCVPV